MRGCRLVVVGILAALAMLLPACGSDSAEISTSASTQHTSEDSLSAGSSAASPSATPESETEPSSTEPAPSPTTATTAPRLTSTSDTPETSDPTTTGPNIPSSGPAPWAAAEAINFAALPDVYRQEWAEAGEPDMCPFLAFADLGPEAAGATIRRGEHDREMLVTWDNPDGPGHDRTGEPCDDCGRGVVGLATFQHTGHVGQATIAWDDGSFANVAELPWVYGVSARIQPAGAECIYQLWSHLGYNHVAYLIGRLRLVDA